MNDHRLRGFAREADAERWLIARGLRGVARNFRCKAGELDLIMLDAAQLVFVEVRFRRDDRFGGAAASVTASKQRRLAAAAQFFIATHPRWRDHACRFDVMAGRTAAAPAGIDWQWLRDAFGA